MKKPSYYRLTCDEKAEVCRLYEAGSTAEELSETVGVPLTSIYRALR